MCLKHSSSATATGTLVTKVEILIKTVLLGTTTKLGQHDHFLVDFFDFDLDSMAFFASLLQIVWQHEGCEGCNCATQLYFISADSDIDFL